ncbi:golgin subfamily A member 4-like isoform X2 [Colletes gigas]|nr:golgin subfamily A member 4-like isoform X2 [Colletes gigas]XP_043265048.1 golgin subfamily A member 4-like isoform X2 [Colletes gigas]
MLGMSEEPPGTKEEESIERPTIGDEGKCEENKSQLENFKEIMLKNKQGSKKEEEVQEYARRLSKIKSRAKLSRRHKEGILPGKGTSVTSDTASANMTEQAINDISQAKTAKAKSTLLQKKLAEDRKVFEQRNKERTETKRAVEEKVEAIRQQLEEKDVPNTDLATMGLQKDHLSVTPINPIMITSEIMSPIQIENIREKENKIAELNDKIFELEAIVVDLQENLKDKDSVIDSKTKAVTLMSADLSMKGKMTLDTLEDTKDEMRTMQEYFELIEASLKNKNKNLLMQLEERDNKIVELEESIKQFGTVAVTKEDMKSLQENFLLKESSLKMNNDNLLQQLEDYELKLAEAYERVFKLESGIGIERNSSIDDLQYKLEKLEHSNKQLQDEKYELQKSVADLQDKIINVSLHGNGAIIEKDNRIVELENLIEELKQSNTLLEEESKVELQKQLADVTQKNGEYINKIADLENLVHELEEQKSNIAARLSDENAAKDDEKVAKLTKELEELNKSMIKIKAQHRSKVKNLQKQLENFKMVSDTNAELVRLANQVALLEEEKGNLQLNLVDFDELKASAGDWQERIADLESKVSVQSEEIQMQIEAIAALENQKLDLMQEIHTAKQEISSLEAENAESENLRVTAEMKIVNFEEQLEAMHKLQNESKLKSSSEVNQADLIKQIETLTQENSELYNIISKLEYKGDSDSGSTESFEDMRELVRNYLLQKIEDLTQKNSELTMKLNKAHEKENSQIEYTEPFEANTDLTMNTSQPEEKGSSDTGSTESFERIPGHNESKAKLETFTQENNKVVLMFRNFEKYFEHTEPTRLASNSDVDMKSKVDNLLEENNQSLELSKLRMQLAELNEENNNLQKQIEILTEEEISSVKSEDPLGKSKREIDFTAQIDELLEEKTLLQKEIKELRNNMEQSHDVAGQGLEINNLKSRIEELLKEKEEIFERLSELEKFNEKLKEEVTDVTREKEQLHIKINQMLPDDSTNERLGVLEKLEKIYQENQELGEQINKLLEKSNKGISETQQLDEPVSHLHIESMIATSLEQEIEEHKKLIAEQNGLIEEMKIKLTSKEEELEEKAKLIIEYEASGQKMENLESELKEMQEKMEKLRTDKAVMEEEFRVLENKNEMLLEEKNAKDVENNLLKQQMQDTTILYESQIQEHLTAVSKKENEIVNLKDVIEDKDQELHAKYTELQNKMIMIDQLQDELNNCRVLLEEKDASITKMLSEVANLNDLRRSKEEEEEEIYSLRKDIDELNNKLKESIPLKDYDELLQECKSKDLIIDEIQYRMNATIKENSNLLEKVKNLSEENGDMENELAEKQRELVDLIATKEELDARVAESENDKAKAERQVWELQSIIENNAKYVEDLQTELRAGYKQIEQLKVKHTEDMELQNQRLESLIEELNSKTQECESLRGELEEKERLVGQNLTEEVKVALEAKVIDLDQKLRDSEGKIQMQLEKMKKIAANLKKKTVVCQELETRVTELEEKWMTEKDEKEAKNKQIQDVELSMREKDNKIADLEEKLIETRNEIAEGLRNIGELISELNSTRGKMSLHTQQITEMEEEILKLRAELDISRGKIDAEKEAKENVMLEYEGYKRQISEENEWKEYELNEVKEKARELSVRMQVMEAEYIEQLATIKNLKTEYGLLLSKQTQINEKLENVETESEERRVLIERMQKSVVSTATEATQTTEEEIIEDDAKIAGAQRCGHCEQCQTLVQALEAKLQEREAEIENLDNELANSIGNFVQIRESLKFHDLMNQTTMRDRSLIDPYNEILMQYNALTSRYEELLKENKELAETVENLQVANVTLEEKIGATEKSESDDSSNSDLAKRCESRETELLNVQREMQVVQERATRLEEQLNLRIASLRSEEEKRIEMEKLLQDTRNSLEQEIESLKTEKDGNRKTVEDLRAELEMYKNETVESKERSTIVKREASVFDLPENEQDNAPRLFDASKIFGAFSGSGSDSLNDIEVKRLQTLLDEKETQCSNLTQQIDYLQKLMIEERSQMTRNFSQHVEELGIARKELHEARANLDRLEQALTERDGQIDSLNVELRNFRLRITEQQNELSAKENEIQELNMNLTSTEEALTKLIVEQNEQNVLSESYRSRIATLEAEFKNSTDPELIQDLEHRVSNITRERDLLQLQVNDLSRSLEETKDSLEAGRNLQRTEMEKTARERDEAKELVADLTKGLEEAYKNSDRTSAKESTRLEEAAAASATIAEEDVKQTAPSDTLAEFTWDAEKLNVDEETWDWNADDAQLAGEHLPATLLPNAEMQLRAKVDDLQDRIGDLEAERNKLLEENKAAQLRSGRMIKKLKEYKVQVESLQQQLKIQKSASYFYELDSAIEEELKSQISKLEKGLNEARDEQRNTVAEKETLTKRLDVVVSANERYMEMKERQDMDMEVLRIRNKELTDKLEALDQRLQEFGGPRNETVPSKAEAKPIEHDRRRKRSVDSEDLESLCKRYKDEIDDLKDEMEALATENEQLQHFLGEQKTKLSSLESKRTADENESLQIVDELNKRISELQGVLSKSREEYDTLKKQYEQSLMDADNQVSIMRQNADYLKEEAFERVSKLEMVVTDLRKQLDTFAARETEWLRDLEQAMGEKAALEEKLTNLTSDSEKQLSAIGASMAEVTDLLNVRIQEVADLKQELQRQYVDHEETKSKLQDTIERISREANEKKEEAESLRKALDEKENEFVQRQSVETVSALVSQATQELAQKHAIEIEEKEKELRSLKENLSVLEQRNDHELQLLRQNLTEKESALESLRSNLSLAKEQLVDKESRVSESEKNIEKLLAENQRYVETIGELQSRLSEAEAVSARAHEYVLHAQGLERELENMRAFLAEKDRALERYVQESSKEHEAKLASRDVEINELREELATFDDLKTELLERAEQMNSLSSELDETSRMLSNRMLYEKEMELNRLSMGQHDDRQQGSVSNVVDGLPLFRMADDSRDLQRTIDAMQVELEKKQSEIQHLKCILEENTYRGMVQEMQDRINSLYNEKAELESFLEVAALRTEEKEKQIDDLKRQIEKQSLESVSKDETNSVSRDRRSVQDQEEIVRLQNELHAKEQEVNELKYVIAEKDSQLSLQASMEPQSDDFESREMVQRLTAELYGKEQEIQQLRSTIAELETEVSRLGDFERLYGETKDAMSKLSLEKEQEPREFLETKLREKEMEIDEIKQKLLIENKNIMDQLQLRDRDIVNLRKQLEESSMVVGEAKDKLREKEEESVRLNADLAEKERRLAELSITKDTELHNLKVQIHEREVRIDELLALSDEEEKQLNELKSTLEARETEINSLKSLLEDKVKEYELIQNVLKKEVSIIDASASGSVETPGEENKMSTSQELDLALYMLHQRDVRCEELTHELMQLLEERDTLQLRLSNAIRVNEELRKVDTSDNGQKTEASASGTVEPLVEHPSPSKSEGPIEIAREAIDSPIGENKEALAQKLSQLHTVSHAKDVRLKDERELRHTQQMSLLAHKDVLSTLPAEAAAKLVNANYTLSRDVQSQSSVLLNWLWGKSTPKVMHM